MPKINLGPTSKVKSNLVARGRGEGEVDAFSGRSRGNLRNNTGWRNHTPATLRSWVLRRPYPTARGLSQFAPVLKLAKADPPTLSFSNRIQAHVLRSLRAEHGVSLGAVRQALAYAQRELKIDQLLLREELCAAGGELFLDRYGELTNLSASGQIAMRKVFEAHLKRVEWDKRRFAVRLYPFVSESADARSIVIDPQISFGRPVVNKAFISARSIVDRIDAGEKVEDVARDYNLTRAVVEEAVVYERAA
jgi:uncharacterized protein (DUF433 family)